MITLTLLFSLHFLSSHALHNVTVDNTSPLIIYQGPWPTDGGGFAGYDVDDTQSTIDVQRDGSSAPSATATFTFTGTAIYYWSPLWPYQVTTVVTLDNQAPVAVKLIDYSTNPLLPVGSTGPSVVSDIRWSQTGLSNTQHTLTMSLMASSRYIVVDALTYTALDPSDITPPVSSTTKSTTGSGASSLASASSTATTHLSGSSGSMMASATDGSQFVSGSSRAGATGLSTPGSPNSPSSSSSSQSSSGTGSGHSHSKTFVAVAAALGSLLFVAVLAILLLVRRRRRPKPDGNSSLAPFLVDMPSSYIPLSDRKGARVDDQHQEWSMTTSPTPADANPSLPVASSSDPRISMMSYAYTAAPPPYQPG